MSTLSPCARPADGHQPAEEAPTGPLVKPVGVAIDVNDMIYVTQRNRMDITVIDTTTGLVV